MSRRTPGFFSIVATVGIAAAAAALCYDEVCTASLAVKNRAKLAAKRIVRATLKRVQGEIGCESEPSTKRRKIDSKVETIVKLPTEIRLQTETQTESPAEVLETQRLPTASSKTPPELQIQNISEPETQMQVAYTESVESSDIDTLEDLSETEGQTQPIYAGDRESFETDIIESTVIKSFCDNISLADVAKSCASLEKTCQNKNTDRTSQRTNDVKLEWILVPGEEDDGTLSVWLGLILGQQEQKISVAYARKISHVTEIQCKEEDIQLLEGMMDTIALPQQHEIYVLYEPRKFKKKFRIGVIDESVAFYRLKDNDYTMIHSWQDFGETLHLLSLHTSSTARKKIKQCCHRVIRERG